MNWLIFIVIICSEREYVLLCFVADNIAHLASHPCDKSVGHMGKEPVNTCNPHRADYCMVVVFL